MKKLFLVLAIILAGCEDNNTKNESSELTFISTEGNFGSSNGSVSVFRNGKLIQEVKDIGDVVQSILVHNNKLFVLVNNSKLLHLDLFFEEKRTHQNKNTHTHTPSILLF